MDEQLEKALIKAGLSDGFSLKEVEKTIQEIKDTPSDPNLKAVIYN